MSTIQELFQQAQLTEAAYANFIDPNTGLPYTLNQKITDALQDTGNHMTFSVTQADDFALHWKVITQQANTASGFSATLFQRIDTDPISGFQEGQYVYAVRGTEPEAIIIWQISLLMLATLPPTGWQWINWWICITTGSASMPVPVSLTL